MRHRCGPLLARPCLSCRTNPPARCEADATRERQIHHGQPLGGQVGKQAVRPRLQDLGRSWTCYRASSAGASKRGADPPCRRSPSSALPSGAFRAVPLPIFLPWLVSLGQGLPPRPAQAQAEPMEDRRPLSEVLDSLPTSLPRRLRLHRLPRSFQSALTACCERSGAVWTRPRTAWIVAEPKLAIWRSSSATKANGRTSCTGSARRLGTLQSTSGTFEAGSRQPQDLGGGQANQRAAFGFSDAPGPRPLRRKFDGG